jgi:hypothetical protein
MRIRRLTFLASALFLGLAGFLKGQEYALANGIVTASWIGEAGGLGPGQIRDAASGREVPAGPDQCWLEWAGGEHVAVSRLRSVGPIHRRQLLERPTAARLADRLPGTALEEQWEDPAGRFTVTWSAELRDGSRYVRLGLAVTNRGSLDLPLQNIGLLNTALAGAQEVGSLSGSPVAAGPIFLGVEHPLADNRVEAGRVLGSLPRLNSLRPGETVAVSAVVGFTDPGQLRRGFLAYLERERARPYAGFLHYNTWYSLGYFNRFTQDDFTAVIRAFGRELIEKRGVQMNAFVLDDGWDDPKTLWKFDAGFPEGLGPSRTLAAHFGAGLGMWLSPWGGYQGPKQQRLKYGAAEGFEIREGSFSLAGPNYYERFRDLCENVVRRDGVVYFKFDGIGAKETGRIDPAAGRDFEAMLRLIGELRVLEPGIFINQTTGTWPSPFWLRQVDSIWRGGEDHAFAGVGTYRQRWMTYRDAEVYHRVVQPGPLYPLNSLMVHGIIYAALADHLQTDPGDDFAREVRTYFGSGTQLQELYLSPQLLSSQNWDDLAAAARWSRANAATLRDTHWIGGDPAKLEVYGWAAWSERKGLITLRNPSDRPAAFRCDIGPLFELPAQASRAYTVRSPYADAPAPVATLRAGQPTILTLPPYAVLVLEAEPAAKTRSQPGL